MPLVITVFEWLAIITSLVSAAVSVLCLIATGNVHREFYRFQKDIRSGTFENSKHISGLSKRMYHLENKILTKPS